MPRKKKIDEPAVVEQGGGAVVKPELVDVTAVVGDIEKAGETVEMIWVETVDELGRHMIQVPKKG